MTETMQFDEDVVRERLVRLIDAIPNLAKRNMTQQEKDELLEFAVYHLYLGQWCKEDEGNA